MGAVLEVKRLRKDWIKDLNYSVHVSKAKNCLNFFWS